MNLGGTALRTINKLFALSAFGILCASIGLAQGNKPKSAPVRDQWAPIHLTPVQRAKVDALMATVRLRPVLVMQLAEARTPKARAPIQAKLDALPKHYSLEVKRFLSPVQYATYRRVFKVINENAIEGAPLGETTGQPAGLPQFMHLQTTGK